ncbi:MAG: acetylxylan esterase [Thermoguttaceae bacterium]|jgi:cephalosporin-C deacetylase
MDRDRSEFTLPPAHRAFLFSLQGLLGGFFLLGALLCGTASLYCADGAQDIRFAFDRAEQVYQVGESATVTMTVIADNGQTALAGMLYCRVTNDGRDTLDWREFDLSKANPVTLNVKLDFPGHVLLKVTASGEGFNGNVDRFAGLSFDPQKIEPGLPKPDDFDQFWAGGRVAVREIPLDPEIVPLAEFSTETTEVSQVGFATLGGGRVYGFLSKPVGEGPFPAIVNVPGAGPGTGPDLALPSKGFATLVMNVFPYPVPTDPAERQQVHDEYNKSLGCRYCYLNAENRENYFYRNIYLGIDRAIDWFAGQSFVDKNRIGFCGTSQGGASALILTSMNKNIKATLASVPALCDHAGQLKGRASGWPRLLDFSNGDPAVLEASRYLDGVNFARSIEVPIRVTVGFIDMTCPPSSVWSAYNVIPSTDKEMLLEQSLGHANGKEYERGFRWLLDKVRDR